MPRHIGITLIADLPEIAMPVLAKSPVFIDAELVDIVATGSPAQQIAIACRAGLSSSVSAALAEVGTLEAVVALLMNGGAVVRPNFLHRIAERFPDSAEVCKMLGDRADLKPETWLLLIDRAAERLREQFGGRHWLPATRIDAMVREQFDKAVIAFASGIPQAGQQALVGELMRAGRLSAAFLLRAVCMGNIAIFASALALLARVPAARAEAIVGEPPGAALRALYHQAGLPPAAYGVFSDLLQAWRRELEGSDEVDAARLAVGVTRRVLAGYRGPADGEMDGLLVLLRAVAAENERDCARRELGRLEERRRNAPLLRLAPPATSENAEVPCEAADRAADAPEPLPELPPDIVMEFACHLAEELVDLEESLAGAGGEPPQAHLDGQAAAAHSVPQVEAIAPADRAGAWPANDDRPGSRASDRGPLSLRSLLRARADAA